MLKKIILGIIIFVILFNNAIVVKAIEINKADLVKIGNADYHLKYYKEDAGYSSYIICSIIGYNKEKFYPAYCMNKDLPGVENGEYSVNIKELINNPAVWRVVTNGYPYLEPYQMGLQNEFDAYTVTKHAVYCVLGQTKLENYSYDENDIVGHRMYDVLKYLVDIGINGSNMPKKNNIEINKIGELIDSGEFYLQEYIIKSKINIKKLEIKEILNFPERTFIANINNNPQNVFKNGEKFRILIPKDGLKKDIKGIINIYSEVEKYPIFYGEAPNGKQDYIITYDTYGEESIKVDVEIPTNTGKLKVSKVDSDTNIGIKGIKFELINQENNIKYEKITDENGEILFDKLYPGNYILKELETLNEYKINEKDFYISIEYNKISEIIVHNELKKGSIKILKIDGENEEKRIGGVVFELYDSKMNLLEILKTDENGEAFSNEYPVFNKKYYLKEIESKAGYLINKELIEIDLINEEILEVIIKNYKVPEESDNPKEIIETPKIEKQLITEEVKKLPKTGM